MIISAGMGLFQEVTYKKHGKQWREGLFYTVSYYWKYKQLLICYTYSIFLLYPFSYSFIMIYPRKLQLTITPHY
jgi:hypothetical protein